MKKTKIVEQNVSANSKIDIDYILAHNEKLANDRISFARLSGKLPLPYLCEIQVNSYDWFKQKGGLDDVFDEIFPIQSYSGDMKVDYVKYEFGESKYSFLECKARNFTYSVPLYATLRLSISKTGEIKEHKVFMGEFPLMTDSGTFVINGAERVIVSQIVRSPGAYLDKLSDPKSGHILYEADLIPTRGTWLEFETDLKDLVSVRIDRQRKIHASILLKALGLDEKNIISLFGETPNKADSIINKFLVNTLEKDADTKTSQDALETIFKKLKPGEPYSAEGVADFLVSKFFDHKRYDLGHAGRFKYGNKLGIYNRLPGRILAENLVSVDGEIKFAKGYQLTKDDVDALKDEEFFEKGAHERIIKANPQLVKALIKNSSEEGKQAQIKAQDVFKGTVNIVKVYSDEKKSKETNVIGTGLKLAADCVTLSDIIAVFSYLSNIIEGFGEVDDIDNLGNRRIRSVGELIQNVFRVGLSKMAKTVQQKMSVSDPNAVTVQSLINIRPLTSSINEFFASSQLSQFMDQTNPLAELTNKRRISALGPGGITRDRASMEVRDVHYTHYGRICPIETPEGQNIGLISNLACYARINKYGFIETPYRKVDKDTHRVLSDAANSEYLSADQERNHVIAQANANKDESGVLLDEHIIARSNDENIMAAKEDIDYIDVSPKQIVSIASACIPFLENDDSTRALMGANMQRQALPLLRPTAPFVGTGLEHTIAKDSGLAVVANSEGEVTYVDSKKIVTKHGKEKKTYILQKFDRSNQGTCINQVPIVKLGDKVKSGDVIADGPAMQNGDLALGQNVTIAFMTWNGYNYEDAVIMSERLVKDDTYTSIHIEKYELECRETKLGAEEITRDVPNVNEEAKSQLDERGIVVPGAEVKEGDILVGKVTPKGQTEPTPEEKLMMAIFAEKAKEGKDTSLRVPHGGAGIVHDVKIFTRANGDELPPGVNEVVHVYIVQKRKISEGDKMSGRHGNKGVISRILPVEDMPFLPDGTPIDIMLNPLGVPSRMNIGQILEIHLGLACKKLGIKIATPVFDGIKDEEIYALMDKAGIAKDGKTTLYDGRTGERFDERISVGVMYMIKLVHMVDDKLHARSVGPYSLVTQQPLGGKAQNGGQRFGEMEVWALEAYGAAHTLEEILTIKSDDRAGRRKTYAAIVNNKPLPRPGMPEAFKVLTKELKGLGMNVELYEKEDGEKKLIDMDKLAEEEEAEERKASAIIRNSTSESKKEDDEKETFTAEDARQLLEQDKE